MPKIMPPCKVWQWDINDTVTVEGIEDISKWQVHFATVGDTTALVIEIHQDMTAYIPNQLVELGTAIYAYLYNVREERAYTETAVLIPVNTRPKPSDYISEPTDVLTWGQLRADIGTLSQLATEDKTSLVAAVNELHGDIDSIETDMTEQGQSITAMRSDVETIKQSITDINSTDTAQSQQIAQTQQDIDELAQSDTQLAKSVSSLAQTVDKGFKQVQTALDKKQPVGDYITSVNGNAPDEGGNVSIDVQTYTAGEGIDISESGEIAVTNPMNDEQVSAGTTWSSLNVIKQLSQPFSQSGSIITCYPVDGSPLHVVSDITAAQEGEGDPSPDNVRPISGWNSAKLTRCGKNLFDRETSTLLYAYISSSGIFMSAAHRTAVLPCKPNQTYSITTIPTTHNLAVAFTQSNPADNTAIPLMSYATSTNNIVTATSTTTSNYMLIYIYNFNTDLAVKLDDVLRSLIVELGSAATSYEPYRGQAHTADFPETVYGGTLDWSTGVLTVTWVKADLSQPFYYPTGGNGVRFNKALDDNYNHNTTALCSHGLIVKNIHTHGFIIGADNNNNVYAVGLLDDLGLSSIEEYKTWAESNTIELYYKTNHPYTIQLTPTQILAISGLNTVYCDTGDVTVTGYEDPRHTVAQLTSRIAALESAATGI